VDAVLIIGEHGNYPVNKLGQRQYPRYEFFNQVAEVFRRDGEPFRSSTTSTCRGDGNGLARWVDTARMMERRRGGERGVVALQACVAMRCGGRFRRGHGEAGGWDPELFEACLCRSQTLAQTATFSHRYPTARQVRAWVQEPVAYRFEYADGLKATMLLFAE